MRARRQTRRIEMLALHLHDDPVQSAVADYRQRANSRAQCSRKAERESGGKG
jgi:hypothetical protein